MSSQQYQQEQQVTQIVNVHNQFNINNNIFIDSKISNFRGNRASEKQPTQGDRDARPKVPS